MVKLIIWDLDDTLWAGTLSDHGAPVVLFEQRVAMIRAFNARGVVSSICSKNDHETARARLVELGIWDEFVFPHIAFEPKPQAIAGIIADMQLRAPDVLFVDDNPLNLEEVRHVLPAIQTLDATRDDADAVLAGLLAGQTGTRSRVADYRVLEAKRNDRVAATGLLSDTEFLHSCGITVAMPFCMEALDHVDRIAEMVNRSNQLNYTQSRVSVEGLREDIIDVVRHASLAIFAWDRYGDYGLVGFVMLRHRPGDTFDVVHFVFSCRAMHMGLEQYALDHLPMRADGLYPPIPRIEHPSFAGRFARTPSDWIACRSVDDPKSRRRLAHDPEAIAAPVMRIMANCQSGGLAHFSAHRERIVFDSFPNVFLLSSVLTTQFTNQTLPPYIVYAVGTEYSDGPWGPLASAIDFGLYQLCAQSLAAYIADLGIEMLVLLPPDDQPESFYHPEQGMSRERTRAFNAIWRDIVTPGLSIGELALLHGPEEMYDINHHRPASLQVVAGLIDLWYEQVSAARDEAEPARQAA